MTLIKSHSYTINLANVQYIRPHTTTDGTVFKMISNDHVKITCPYDVVIHQLAGSNVDATANSIVHLEY